MSLQAHLALCEDDLDTTVHLSGNHWKILTMMISSSEI